MVRLHHALPALWVSHLFDGQGIDVLTMAFDLPVPNIPNVRVCNVSMFVRCTVYASEPTQ
jgi:hypothetical protein